LYQSCKNQQKCAGWFFTIPMHVDWLGKKYKMRSRGDIINTRPTQLC
jgi:hypothetical protein